MSPVLRSTEHEVWKLMVVPPIETRLSASKLPWMVNDSPSLTDLVCPFMVTLALAGKLLVREPYAREPWLLLLLPWPLLYKKVIDDGRFLLLLLQIMHD